MEYVPDNYDAFVIYETEQERVKRLHKRMQIELESFGQEECNE